MYIYIMLMKEEKYICYENVIYIYGACAVHIYIYCETLCYVINVYCTLCTYEG